jgi:hypothetical protein
MSSLQVVVETVVARKKAMRIIYKSYMTPDSGNSLPVPLKIHALSECCGGVLSGSKNHKRVDNDPRNSDKWRRDELLSLLSTSGSLAGLCITVVALMNTFNKTRADVTVVDDMLAVCAAAFLLSTYLIFWALRTHANRTSAVLLNVVDGVFLSALTFMIIAGFIMIHTIW